MNKSINKAVIFFCILFTMVLDGYAQDETSPQNPTSKYPKGFSIVSSMLGARDDQTATLLQDGRVLIVGGEHPQDIPLASAELYDPKTGKFSVTGSMSTARLGQSATLLADGRVLIAGGYALFHKSQSTAELYDPQTGKFNTTGSMNKARTWHTATLLNDGKVLIVAGDGSNGTDSTAELYDPKTGRFTFTGSPVQARKWHTATLLNGGRVLITGGWGRTALSSAEIYEPSSGTFSSVQMLVPRSGHTATLLPDGSVLLIGGQTATAEVFDSKNGKFINAGSMSTMRFDHIAALLPDGNVIVACGTPDGRHILSSVELWNCATKTFSPAGAMPFALEWQASISLKDGAVLITGGYDGSVTESASAVIYQP